MKLALEIILSTIHLGSARRVVTLGLDGEDLAEEFLTSVAKSNHKGFDAIRSRVKAIAEYEHYENEYTFRHVGDGIYEFKRPGLRLYAFYDELPGLKPQLIIATNGGSKKDQQADIARAKARKIAYDRRKASPGVKIRLLILPDEN